VLCCAVLSTLTRVLMPLSTPLATTPQERQALERLFVLEGTISDVASASSAALAAVESRVARGLTEVGCLCTGGLSLHNPAHCSPNRPALHTQPLCTHPPIQPPTALSSLRTQVSGVVASARASTDAREADLREQINGALGKVSTHTLPHSQHPRRRLTWRLHLCGSGGASGAPRPPQAHTRLPEAPPDAPP
jgi:hypothetical protein